MNVFRLRDQLVGQYSLYVRSFIQISDQHISEGNRTLVVLADSSAVPRSEEIEFVAGLALCVLNTMVMPELEAFPEMVPEDELEACCKVG